MKKSISVLLATALAGAMLAGLRRRTLNEPPLLPATLPPLAM